MTQTTLVTGGAGFIGSHVAEVLLSMNHRVLVLDDLSGGFEANIPRNADFERRDAGAPLDDIFNKYRPDVVFHLAAYAAEGLSHHIPVFNYRANLVATANVLAASYRARVRHFVFTSSIGVYGHPKADKPFRETDACEPCDPYGIAKHACEQHICSVCSYYGAPTFTIFRPHNVFGPRQNISDPFRNVVGIFMRRLLSRQPMPVFGDGSQTRSFSFINSTAVAIATAPWIKSARNELFNIGEDESMSVRELAESAAAALSIDPIVEYLDPRNEVKHAHCDHRKARAVFADAYSKSVPIAKGLKIMAKHVTSNAIPPPTPCPSKIEIEDNLPRFWRTESKATSLGR